MKRLKVHSLKQLLHKLEGHSRLLVIGPLQLNSKIVKMSIKELKPDFIIFVDGGLHHKNLFTNKQLRSSFSVGDGDSLLIQEEIGSIDVKLPVKKDYSDLAFVLNAIVKLKNEVLGLGFLGFSSPCNEERIDHLIFNLSEVEKITSLLKIRINLDGRFIFLPPGLNKLKLKGIFSVMSFSNTLLKITGKCEYKLEEWSRLKRLSSLGLSNVGKGTIYIECKKSILVYLTNGPKIN